MPSVITNVKGAPVTLPEPYVVILKPHQGVTVADAPATVIANLGGAERINGLLTVALAPAVGTGAGALPAEAGKYAKKAGDTFTGAMGFDEVATFAKAPSCTLGLKVATVASIPVAAEALEGTLWLVKGGTGVASVMKVCVKSAADVYEWKTLAYP